MKRSFLAAIAAASLGTTAQAHTHAEEVTVAGPEGALAGTLVAPAEGKPVVIILPGSGPTDRDGNNPMGVTASTYRLLSEGLAAHGIGSLRIDKRGLFASKVAVADGNNVTIGDYADDVDAWAKLVRARTGRDCVWLLGHSEGGIVALAAANRLEGICGLVLAATPGRPLGTLLREQIRGNPANAPILEQANGAIAQLENGERVDPSTLHPGLAPLFAEQIQGYLIDLMAQDPAKLLQGTNLPVLILHGDKDLQVIAADADALAAARPDAERVNFSDMNHVLKDVAGDDRMTNLTAYSQPDLPLTAGLVDRIAAFVEGQR